MDELPSQVLRWRAHGDVVTIGDHDIFVVEDGSGELPFFVLHGFPGSSYDWSVVLEKLAETRRVVSFDMLGYGFSDKPAEHAYSLFGQADLATAVAAAQGIERCVLVGHDMGDTVAAELLARQNAGELPFTIERVVLTNGSIFIDMAQLTDGQKLLLSLPDEVLAESLPGYLLEQSIGESFPPGWVPSAEVSALVAVLQLEGGDRLLPRLIRYIEERRRHQDRWTAGLVEFAGPLTAIWGELDPIAVPTMPRRLAGVRPATEVVTWSDIGHWPSMEAPGRLAAALLERSPAG